MFLFVVKANPVSRCSGRTKVVEVVDVLLENDDDAPRMLVPKMPSKPTDRGIFMTDGLWLHWILVYRYFDDAFQ